MASHHLTAGHPGSISAVERYLTELAAQLMPGPRAARTRVLTEIRDGLTDTIDARLAGGMPPGAAATTAIHEFGDPATVAGSFAEELATASARRTIAAFILTGPLVGIWWLLLLHPAPWRGGVLAALIAIPAIPLIPMAIATAAGTFATTGRLMRWLPETSATRALTAATAIAAICVAADLTVLGLLSTHLATGRQYPAPLIAVAATASFVRIAAAITAIRSTRARRAQLPST
jgi:roadblock/LC7 domain-containing protein